MTRPLLMHERLSQHLLNDLRAAQSADLASLKRWEISNLLFDLRLSRRMQFGCGDVAPREEWTAAEARLEAEMATRPPPKPRKPK